MSMIIKSLLRPTYKIGSHILSSIRSFHFTSVRYLYSSASIGLDGYIYNRRQTKEQFVIFADKFRTRMIEFIADPKNTIFTEDLKNMVHLAEPSDLELVLKMVNKINSQNTDLRFGSYVFGPVVMRMFHFLHAPNEALKCFFDPVNKEFFDQLLSYQILLDLLYNNEMYDEMYKVFEVVKEKQMNMSKFPKYPVVLILGACYKQNTPQSFEYATKLWSEMANMGTVPLRRACTFFAGLALKQGAPHIALESLINKNQHYVTLRNIKVTALSQLGRVEAALPLLRAVLHVKSPQQKDKHTFFEETVNTAQEAVQETGNKDLIKEFDDIHKALKDRGLIDNQTLDEHLTVEITLSKPDIQTQFQNKNTAFPNRQRTNLR